MKKRGYDYTSPPQLFQTDWNRSHGVSQEEVKVAVAHVKCAVSTNMVGIWETVLTAYQNRAIAQNPDYFATLQKHDSEMDSAAAKILSGQN